MLTRTELIMINRRLHKQGLKLCSECEAVLDMRTGFYQRNGKAVQPCRRCAYAQKRIRYEKRAAVTTATIAAVCKPR